MNKRLVLMMQSIAQAERGMGSSLSSLSEEFDVSVRTVRSDIGEVNRFLRAQHLQTVAIDRDGDVHWSADSTKAFEQLRKQTFYDYKLTSEERRAIALAMLATAEGYVTLAEMADVMYVSRSTMINDLDAIKDAAQAEGLQLQSMASHGLKLVMTEQQVRGLLLRIEQEEPIAFSQWAAGKGRSNPEDDQVIRRILTEQTRAHGFEVNDRLFLRMQRFLSIAVERCKGGHLLPSQEPGTAEKASAFSEEVIRLIEQYVGVGMTYADALGLDEFLAACNLFPKDYFRLEDIRVQQMTRQFISAISDELGTDLNGDYDLFEFLSNHLELMAGEDPSDLNGDQQLKEVIETQPQVLDAVRHHLGIVADFYGRPVSELETTYIALHVCASLERQRNRRSRVRVIVASDVGSGVGQFLSELLVRRFDIRVVKIAPVHELSYFSTDDADLVVTTKLNPGCRLGQFPISSLPTDEELEGLGARLDAISGDSGVPLRSENQAKEAQSLIDSIRPIVAAWAPEQSDALMHDISLEIRRFFREAERIERELASPRLHQLVSPRHVQLNVPCANWEEAIRASAIPLQSEGYIDSSYVDAMVDLVHKNGPYIVFMPGLAVAHADPASGSHKLGMNIIRLSEPIPFGSERFDPVEFVCALAVVDRRSHLKALFNLQTILSHDEFRKALHDARTAEEFWRALSRCEAEIAG
jgi:mannitol operon transcriptional antiterminator